MNWDCTVQGQVSPRDFPRDPGSGAPLGGVTQPATDKTVAAPATTNGCCTLQNPLANAREIIEDLRRTQEEALRYWTDR